MSATRITIKDLAAEIVFLHQEVIGLKRNQNEIVRCLTDHEAALGDLHRRLGVGVLNQILESHEHA